MRWPPRSRPSPSSAIVESKVALIDEATIAITTTSVTPIVSAAAVAAVRFGLRAAFSPARRVAIPPRRLMTRASTRLTGAAMSGPRMTATDSSTAAAPMPTNSSGLGPMSPSPSPISVAPPRRRMPPQTLRDSDRSERSLRGLRQRRDRRDLGRPQRGDERRQHGDDDADDERGDDRAEGQRWCGVAHREHAADQTQQCRRQPESGDQADERRDEPHDDRFEHGGSEHLASTGADGPQQRGLAGALGDDDRERVVDDEDRDEQRDVAEHRHERAEDVDESGDALLALLGERVAGQHLLAGEGEHDVVGELGLGHAILGRQRRRS